MVLVNKLHIAIVVALLGSLCAWIWTEVVLYSENTLLINGQWKVSKRLAEISTMGGDEYLITRSPLAGNRLHLASWYGFQEVTLRDQFRPREIRFRFRLMDQAYFYLTYGRHESRLLAVRFSRKAGLPSAIMDISPVGQFETIELIAPALEAARWHDALIKLEENTCSIRIDGDEVFRGPRELGKEGAVGFRGGFLDGEIDDVRIWGEGRAFTESFGNTKQGWTLFAIHLGGLLILLAALLCAEWVCCSSLRWKIPLVQFSFLALVAIVIGSLYLTFDYTFWSRLPLSVLTQPLPSERQTPTSSLFENLRFGFFKRWYQAAGGQEITKAAISDSGYPANRIHAGPVVCRSRSAPCRVLSEEDFNGFVAGSRLDRRVVFAGTSQTIGVGATNLDETFFVRTHRLLADNLSPLNLESINISIAAVSPPVLLREYEQKYLRLKPDLMVINLGTNGINEDLATGLSGFLEINRSHQISTIIILEPNSSEAATPITEKHHIMRTIADKNHIPILDLQAYLSDPAVDRSGALWWDFVHLTSFGHSLVAKWLSVQLLPHLTALNKNPS